jgi:hypothetical protein
VLKPGVIGVFYSTIHLFSILEGPHESFTIIKNRAVLSILDNNRIIVFGGSKALATAQRTINLVNEQSGQPPFNPG